MSNLDIREFTSAIITFVNQSPLPVEVKRLCVCDIAAQLQATANEQIQTEIVERDKHAENDGKQEET